MKNIIKSLVLSSAVLGIVGNIGYSAQSYTNFETLDEDELSKTPSKKLNKQNTYLNFSTDDKYLNNLLKSADGNFANFLDKVFLHTHKIRGKIMNNVDLENTIIDALKIIESSYAVINKLNNSNCPTEYKDTISELTSEMSETLSKEVFNLLGQCCNILQKFSRRIHNINKYVNEQSSHNKNG